MLRYLRIVLALPFLIVTFACDWIAVASFVVQNRLAPGLYRPAATY